MASPLDRHHDLTFRRSAGVTPEVSKLKLDTLGSEYRLLTIYSSLTNNTGYSSLTNNTSTGPMRLGAAFAWRR
jgi:hypothetical protein